MSVVGLLVIAAPIFVGISILALVYVVMHKER